MIFWDFLNPWNFKYKRQGKKVSLRERDREKKSACHRGMQGMGGGGVMGGNLGTLVQGNVHWGKDGC